MTLMLASVLGSAEAETALAGGADMLDLTGPLYGTLDLPDRATIRATLAMAAGRCPVSAAVGDLPMEPDLIRRAASDLAATGVDYVKIGLRPSHATPACLDALAPLAAQTQIIGVLFADLIPDMGLMARMSAAGFKGALLDTALCGRQLLDAMDITAIDRFVEACRAAGLMAGLAGSLEPPDIDRLLVLHPNFLGFAAALRRAGEREQGLNPEAVKLVRDLIPRVARDTASAANVDWRPLSTRGYATATTQVVATDRVFVHDLILPVAVGAYDIEQGRTQRVRFNIDVDIRHLAHPARDMRDVYSYDLIVDAIQLILSRGHVALVEILAEQIAEALLAHPRVARAKIRVEKLDIIQGCLGVDITRERAVEKAKLHQLFPDVLDLTDIKTGV